MNSVRPGMISTNIRQQVYFWAAEVAALALCWEYILDVDHVVFMEIVLS